jgi:hypothetical protein
MFPTDTLLNRLKYSITYHYEKTGIKVSLDGIRFDTTAQVKKTDLFN